LVVVKRKERQFAHTLTVQSRSEPRSPIMVGGGEFMWSHVPFGQVLPRCVRVTSAAEKWLTKGWAAKYAQNKDKRDLFINVTMVFACVGSHGTLNRDLVGSPEVFRYPSWVSKRSSWQSRRIILDEKGGLMPIRITRRAKWPKER
jgi:hypothetical protein